MSTCRPCHPDVDGELRRLPSCALDLRLAQSASQAWVAACQPALVGPSSHDPFPPALQTSHRPFCVDCVCRTDFETHWRKTALRSSTPIQGDIEKKTMGKNRGYRISKHIDINHIYKNRKYIYIYYIYILYIIYIYMYIFYEFIHTELYID